MRDRSDEKNSAAPGSPVSAEINAEIDACASSEAEAAAMRDALALLSAAGPEPPAGMAARAMNAAGAELSLVRERRLVRRAVGRALLAMLPLPLVVAYAGWALSALYAPLAAWLSADTIATIVGFHTVALSLLFGATYALIPLALDRRDQTSRAWVTAG